MKKVLIFALVVVFLSVVAFADDPSNNKGTVDLGMTIEKAVQIEISDPTDGGTWEWDPDTEAAIPDNVITANVTIKTNTKFKVTGAFLNDTTHSGDIIIQNEDEDKGIKVIAKFNYSPLGGLIDAVDSGVFTYSELFGAEGTGKATGELQFSLESFAPSGETFSWYDVEAGTQTPVQYVATIEPAA